MRLEDYRYHVRIVLFPGLHRGYVACNKSALFALQVTKAVMEEACM